MVAHPLFRPLSTFARAPSSRVRNPASPNPHVSGGSQTAMTSCHHVNDCPLGFSRTSRAMLDPEEGSGIFFKTGREQAGAGPAEAATDRAYLQSRPGPPHPRRGWRASRGGVGGRTWESQGQRCLEDRKPRGPGPARSLLLLRREAHQGLHCCRSCRCAKGETEAFKGYGTGPDMT